ncbi:MAG: HlyD family efflux transporter periplasmic adaptor subunit [Trueperaceae bacterium]|nr:HlyD family efflux transporter periplasmic adaptor subunit [Trueperaceae bacterium]
MRLIRPLSFVLIGAALSAAAFWWFAGPPGSPTGPADAETARSASGPADTAAGTSTANDSGASENSETSLPANLAGLPDSAEAEVRPLRSSQVSFAVSGVLAERLVDEGDDVVAGDALLRLDDAAERARLREADAALAAADAQVGVARSSEAIARRRVTAAEATVRAAEAGRDAADAALRLTATQAEATITQAEAQQRQAEATVGEAQAGVAEARAAVEEAQARVAQAEAQKVQAEAARASAALAVEQRTLRAPFDGRVLALRPEVGETVAAGGSGSDGDGAVTVADLSGWRVETTNLTELQVVGIGVGDRVEVEVDALPDRSFMGTVERIGFQPTLVRGDVTYVAAVRIDDVEGVTGTDGGALRPGMTAVVRDLFP